METEYKKEIYAVSYLNIQSSHISNDLLLFVELLTKRLADDGIVLYTSVQSGKPTPPPCPPGGCQ